MEAGGASLELTFSTCRPDNVEQLRALNRAIFPINYSDRMYQEILACGDVTQLAFHGGTLIGAIGCRLESTPQVGGAGRLAAAQGGSRSGRCTQPGAR